MMKGSHPFWHRWSAQVIRTPRAIISVCLLVTALLGGVVALTPIDLSFMSILGEDDPEIVAIHDQVRIFGAKLMLVMLVEGEKEPLAEAVATLVEELPRRSPAKSVQAPADPQWLMNRAPWFWPDGLFQNVLDQVSGGTASASATSGVALADRVIVKTFQPKENFAILNVEFDANPLDMAIGGGNYTGTARATEEILAELGTGVQASFTGMTATGAQDQTQVIRRVSILTPLTLVAVLFLLLGIETRPMRVAITGIALASSVVIAYGMVGLIQGRLTISATFFGMLLLGLGVDFGIHLLVSLRDGRAHGLDAEQALEQGIQHTGTAIVLGGVSTALAFGLVALTPDPGARDMGLAALFGLLAALVLMLSFVPAAWLLLERESRKADAPARLSLTGLGAIVQFAINHPKKVVFMGAAVALFGLAGIPRYSLESDLEEIFSRDVPSLDVARRLQELFGGSANYFLAPVDTVKEAREWAHKLNQLPDIAQAVSVADFIPEHYEARVNAVKEVLARTPNDGNGEDNPLRQRLVKALEQEPMRQDNLPAAYTTGIIGAEGQLAVRIVPKEDLLEAYALQEQIGRIREIAPTATGMAVLIPLMTINRRDYVPLMVPSVLVVVTLVLIIAFRNKRDVFLALLPVTIGAAATFGIYFWMGLQFSVVTTIVVPVILGLGVDDGIHVVERLRRYKILDEHAIREAVEGVGRPIFLTTATTCASFAGLLLTNHAGLESIAHFMLLGVPLCFLTSITVLPAAVKLFATAGPQ